MKKFACKCGKLATWCYMPSSEGFPYYCDECVSRGCSCNEEYDDPEFAKIEDTIKYFDEKGVLWRWKEEGKVIEHIDEKGRLLPCCEYFYEKDGWSAKEEEVEYFKGKNIEVFLT